MITHKKKIVHILYSGLGGHGNVFFSLVDGDTEKKYAYCAIFMGIEPMREDYIHRCKERQITYHAVLKKQGFDIGAFRKIYSLLRREKPDIVFLHTALNIVPAYFYSLTRFFKPMILVRETQANQLKTRQEWFWARLSMIMAKKIVFLSSEYKQEVKRKMGFLSKEKKMHVIPNGIDLSVFYRPEAAKPRSSENFVFGMQSRLSSNKDHKTLLKSFSLLKGEDYFYQLELRIAGDGVTRLELEALAADLGISKQVVFIGMLEEAGLIEFLKGLNIYIHASKGETMSTAIMQAMAARLPIVASDVDGINNMIDQEVNGILVPLGDPVKMANALHRLFRDKALQDSLSAAAFKTATESFSNLRMFHSYAGLFK